MTMPFPYQRRRHLHHHRTQLPRRKLPPPIPPFSAEEMEEREKLVKHMWDVYTNSRGIKMPKFWQEAFEAAYEELTSDVPGVSEDAISEIAKMSVRYIPIESPPLHSSGIRELSLRQTKSEQTTATGRKL
nr:uncharacterized protein LOC104116484 isoform X2 [Nicotiana tomentosiformis]